MWRKLISAGLAAALHAPLAAPLWAATPVKPLQWEKTLKPFVGEKLEEKEAQSENPPKNLKVRLTLNDPSDLKVYQGSFLAPGDLVAERTRDRARLESQLQQLQRSYNRLQNLRTPQPPVPRIAELPPVSYIEQEAAIASAQVRGSNAAAKVRLQQLKIERVRQLDPKTLPAAVIAHETAKLNELERDSAIARANLNLAQSQLDTAREQRQFTEYQHDKDRTALLVSYNLALERAAERDRAKEFQLAQLTAQMQAIEEKLAFVGKVVSPYWGQVKRIKYESQTNNQISVELTLAVDIDASRFEFGSDGGEVNNPDTDPQGYLEKARERRRQQRRNSVNSQQ